MFFSGNKKTLFYLLILFILLNNAVTYNVTNTFTSSLNIPIASPSGCPNWLGVLVHGLVFVMIYNYWF